MFITNDNILIHIFIGYSLISFLLSIFLSCGFVEENINPFKDAIVAIKEIETIGDLIITIFLSYIWLLATLIYGLVKIFYNRYTVSLMNVKIKSKKG